MKRITLILAASMLLGISTAGAQEDASSMADLLKKIQQGQARDSQEAQQREARFNANRSEQQNLLNQAKGERSRQERESERLEQLFESNQANIVTARTALDERLGALKELFGVLQQVAGDTQARFSNSLTSLQYPDRGEFLVSLGGKMASATELASIEDIEKLWYELQREIAASGDVVRFTHEVTKANGEQAVEEVVRVGAFNVISDSGYLQLKSDGTLAELAKQPDGRLTGTTDDLMDATDGVVDYGVDVTRGGILGLLVQSKTIRDRIEDGGIVGYCIIVLGIFGLLIAIWRWVGLSAASRMVSAQL
jgi:biopolymer transport protein ExbB